MANSKIKRIAAMLLALVTIGTSAALAACNGDSDGGNKEDSGSANNMADEYLDNVLPTDTYNGSTFGIVGGSYLQFEPEEEENSQPVHDALLRRNAKIQERYNVEFKYYSLAGGGHECQEKLSTAALANESIYDIVFGNFQTVGVYGVHNSLLLSSNNFQYVDLNQPWWSQDCMNQLRINDKTMFLAGPINYDFTTDAQGIFFNKVLTDNKSLDNHFDLVRNNQWTIDKMNENMKAVAHDDNGDTTMDENDTWGLDFGSDHGYAFSYGAGINIIEYDEDHTPYFIEEAESIITKVEKLTNILGNRRYVANHSLAGYEAVEGAFTKGKSLYATTSIAAGIDFRAEDFYDFGILPMPKYDETQENYQSWAYTWSGGGLLFPTTCQQEDMTSVLVEALAYQSTVEGGYYDAILQKYIKGRGTYDVDSEEMVDLVLSTKLYDITQIFSMSMSDVVNKAITGDYGDSQKVGLATSFAGTYRSASRSLRSLVKDWNLME